MERADPARIKSAKEALASMRGLRTKIQDVIAREDSDVIAERCTRPEFIKGMNNSVSGIATYLSFHHALSKDCKKENSGNAGSGVEQVNAANTNNYRKVFMDDKELPRRIAALERKVEALQEELNQRALVFEKLTQELTARSNVFYRTEVALLRRHPERAAIAKELRLSTQLELDDKAQQAHMMPHYKAVTLLALNAMLCAAGEPPRL
ncbi:hypothetical protein [Herbaspirillum sp. RV1423]|uniref:hypothetical protein n=1 Tax=Herbaspirillum sp. RV1423 TaxID=1443993 RepID=UPI000552F631|nr:hypothetical protein [Herbaspirillum sp. RV1423]